MRYFDDSESFSLHRRNSDTDVNNYAYRMVDFCKDNNLYILNGRSNEDRSKTTCKKMLVPLIISCLLRIFSLYFRLQYMSFVHCQTHIMQFHLTLQSRIHKGKPYNVKK